MKKLAMLLIILMAVSCSQKREQETASKPIHTFVVMHDQGIDTVYAHRCVAANWTTGGWGIKAFIEDDVVYSYNLPKKKYQKPHTIRMIK